MDDDIHCSCNSILLCIHFTIKKPTYNRLLKHPQRCGCFSCLKEKSAEKIDGAVAMIMALDRAIRNGNVTSESVYDERGILLL